MSSLETIDININTSQIEDAMMAMTAILKEALIDINNTIAEFNSSMNSTGSTVNNVSGVIGIAAGVFSLLNINGIDSIKMTENLGNIFSALTGPIGIATLAITGIIGVISLLSNYQSEETKKHNETMEAMNKEIGARNDLRSKQEEQLQGNLSEIANLQSLNNELKNITKANGEVKAGYEDRAAFIVSTLNKALGEQITIEDGVVKGYEKSSTSINDKIAKLKAEAILEAQLPAYKKALIESTNAQMKADQMQMELSDMKMEKQRAEAELIEKYGKNWSTSYEALSSALGQSYAHLSEDTINKEAEYSKQNEIAQGYYENMANYETNAALLASGNAENYAKVQMDSVSAKGASVEGKKEAMAAEIEAETNHIAQLQEMKLNETDIEKQNQLQAQIDAAQLKIDTNQAELDQLTEHQKKILEAKQLNNVEDMNFLGTCIADKQAKLTEMYATDEEDWTDAQKKEAEALKNSITENMGTYTKFANDKIGKAVELSSKINENSTQAEKDAADSAMREASSTLQILGQNALNKLNILEDLKRRRKDGDKSVTEEMIAEAERQAVEAEKGYGKVAKKVDASWKDLPKSSRETFKNVMNPMMEEMERKEPDLYSKANSIAGGILGNLKKAFDINSPSRKVKKIFESVMEGAEVGLDDKTPELLDQSEDIALNILDVFRNVKASDLQGIVKKMQSTINSENLRMQGLVSSNITHTMFNSGKLQVEVPEFKGTIHGNIENHVMMDGRETAIQLTPFISEELAFSAR